ncbi:MAG: hypothetical protein ACLPJH_06060 [Myxococcaceae bacterium]
MSAVHEMAKTPLPADQEMRQLNVKVPPEDANFVQEVLRPQLGFPYNAEAVREVISQLRTWFRLPSYVVDVLKRDAESQKLHILNYLQMLLHKRYEDLAQEGRERPPPRTATPPPSPSKSGRR